MSNGKLGFVNCLPQIEHDVLGNKEQIVLLCDEENLLCWEATVAYAVLLNWIHLSKKTQPWGFVLLKGNFLRLLNVFLSFSEGRVSGCAAGITVLSMIMDGGAVLS